MNRLPPSTVRHGAMTTLHLSHATSPHTPLQRLFRNPTPPMTQWRHHSNLASTRPRRRSFADKRPQHRRNFWYPTHTHRGHYSGAGQMPSVSVRSSERDKKNTIQYRLTPDAPSLPRDLRVWVQSTMQPNPSGQMPDILQSRSFQIHP